MCPALNPFDECYFTAGDTFVFTVTDSDHPASAWTLASIFRRGTNLLSVAGVADGDSFDVTLSAAQTTTLFPGAYATAFRFTKTADSTVETLAGPTIQVRPNLASATVGPRRTAYNAARTALDALTVSGQQSVSFNGQSFSSQSMGELQTMVDRLYMDALREDRELGIGTSGGLVRIVTRM